MIILQVIVISGKAGAGKDTCAKFITERLELDGYRVLIIHYADLLKFICRTFFDWNGEKDEGGRTLLQKVGTDIVRAQAPDYWVNFVCDMLKFFGDEWDYVIIPDCRFPNEIDRLIQEGFTPTHLKVERPSINSKLTQEQQNHSSETSLDDIVPNDTIINSANLDVLREKMFEWTQNFLRQS